VRSKALTEQILNSDRNESRAFSQEFVGEGAAFFGVCAEHGLEGIVSKRASSRYRSGRSKTWLKTKCFMESDLMLIGIDRDRKTGAERALLANRRHTVSFMPAPPSSRSAERIERRCGERAKELELERPILTSMRGRKARWVRPELTVRVKHLAGARLLRHATAKAVSG